MPVNTMRRMTAAPAPNTIPHSRCRGSRPRQASAITSALSPESNTLIQMILATASQNAGCCISVLKSLKNAPIAVGSKICSSQFKARSSLAGQDAAYSSTDDFIACEKLRDLDRGRFRGIRAVHRVLANRFGVQLADGALRGLGGIGRAHHV